MTIEKRIERVEAILDARGLDWDHPRVEEDHFADASKMAVDEPPKKWRILKPGEVVQEGDWVNAINNKPDEDPPGGGWIPARASLIGKETSQAMGLYVARPVAEEPAKEPEHPAGPKPDPGEGYRLLSKDPPEDLRDGDQFFHSTLGRWRQSINAACGYKRQDSDCWYRRKIEPAKPAWEPKVGDWVKVTRPDDWIEWEHPCWAPQMHQFDGKVGKIESERECRFHICGFAWHGLRFVFHRDWLSPAEPPAIDKPPEPEYREPVLPADIGKACQFSSDGDDWTEAKLQGYAGCFWISVSSEVVGAKVWEHARIKKDA